MALLLTDSKLNTDQGFSVDTDINVYIQSATFWMDSREDANEYFAFTDSQLDFLLLNHAEPDMENYFYIFKLGGVATNLLSAAYQYAYSTKTYEYGLFTEMEVRIVNELPISSKFLKTFLLYAGKKVPESIDNERYNALITKLIDTKEEEILDLYLLEQFKYEEFDKRITQELNRAIKLNPTVPNLDKITKSGATWVWQNEYPINAANWNHFIEKYSFKSDDASFFTPLGPKTPTSESELGGSPALDDLELKGRFSSLAVSDQYIDQHRYLLWDDGDQKIGEKVRSRYNLFLLSIIKAKSEFDQDSGSFNLSNREELFTEEILNVLDLENIETTGPEGLVEISLRFFVYKKIVDAYRKKGWINLHNFLKDYKPAAGDDPDELIRQAIFQGVEEAALDSDVIQEGENASDDDTLSEQDIEARQKFLKQCMLMTRLDEIANENLRNIAKAVAGKGTTVHLKKRPYRNRFYMVQDDPTGDQSAMVNKLIIPPGKSIGEFLNIKPSTHAYLVPKLRFFKVYTGKDGTLKEFQFHFRNFTDPERVAKLSDPGVFDRGGDYGIRSFDFSFQGANPATAKNDIKANLSLYFQTFNDFIDKKFTSDDKQKHAFVDMLLLPSGKSKEGSGSPSIFQYNAKYYRIRVDVGWEIESTKTKDLESAIGISAAANLARSLKKINKSFLLNMVDHTMDFRDDGSVQIDVEYRAYIESALKGTSMDALASKKSRAALIKVRKDYENVLSKNRCTVEELNEIRLQLQQIEDLFKKQSYQSIMNRLIGNGTIYFKKANDRSGKEFIKKGILTTKVNFQSIGNGPSPESDLTGVSEAETNFTNSESGFTDLNNSEDYLYINYFYIGDLLYAILDILYDDNEKYFEGYEKFKFVLGSFQFEDLLDNNVGTKTINIANIPISCELFFEWFTENIIKPERNSYPIMFFIRDLCKFLIVEILSETCFKRSLNKSLQFKTMNFLGKAKNGKDPLRSLYPVFRANKPEALVLDLSKKYGEVDSPLPLEVDDEAGISINDLYNYVTIYVETPRLKSEKDATTTKQQDEAKGIIHYQIGRDRGILKKIKFSKTDMQYIREARFFRHGNDGLMQLSAVYKVSMDMIGNTLYYPGMEIFIDPLGLFGVDNQADPRVKNSIANRLGFGGYHLVTNVKSSIGPGKFTTTVDALFSYSGDGDPSSRVVGTKQQIKKSENNKINEAPDDRPGSYKNYCIAVKDAVFDSALGVSTGNDYRPISDQVEQDFNNSSTNEELAAVQTQVLDETADPLTGQGQSDIEVQDIVSPDLPTSESVRPDGFYDADGNPVGG